MGVGQRQRRQTWSWHLKQPRSEGPDSIRRHAHAGRRLHARRPAANRDPVRREELSVPLGLSMARVAPVDRVEVDTTADIVVPAEFRNVTVVPLIVLVFIGPLKVAVMLAVRLTKCRAAGRHGRADDRRRGREGPNCVRSQWIAGCVRHATCTPSNRRRVDGAARQRQSVAARVERGDSARCVVAHRAGDRIAGWILNVKVDAVIEPPSSPR